MRWHCVFPEERHNGRDKQNEVIFCSRYQWNYQEDDDGSFR